ncbi:dynein light chain Tctex-type protein 2B [Pristis pectinata]|uniref:dynein light chain Tctex-type protein 2B n=1 Tax=Pristis pectinata TaxID=685728 RepID=UPI00223D4C6A|nr:dynein light chain Tctex-type protein 2B [Pristis pectinata]
MGENSYSIRPAAQHRFKPAIVKGKINTVLKEELTNKFYDPEEVPILTRKIAETIKAQVKECAFERYKLVVQVVIGEQRGEGVKMAARCFWDADTDNFAQAVYMNDSLFCVAAAFGCYHY